MASGTINFSQSASSGRYIDGKIEWSSSADKNANTSDVTATIYVLKGHTSTTLTESTSGTWKYSITINGTSKSGSSSLSVLTSWVKVGSFKLSDVSHDSDGEKSITIKGSVSAPSGTTLSGHTTSGSGTATLDSIPRASSITSASAVTLGNKCNIKWTPASSSFRYKINFSLDDFSYTTGVIYPKTTSEYTYTGYNIPLSVANYITDSKTGTMTAKLYTYSDSGAKTQVGSASSKTFTVKVPSNSSTVPAITATLSPVSSLPDAFSGLYVQGKTKVKTEMSATGQYNATISSYGMTVDGTSRGSNATCISDYLSYSGSTTVECYAVDSRGYKGTTSEKITVIAYSKPKIMAASGESGVVAKRCDSSGNIADNGTYLKIKAKRSYSPVKSGGTQNNFCKIMYRYKAASDSSYSSWVTILDKSDTSSDEIVTDALLDGALLVTNTYTVQVGVQDDIGNSSSVTITVPTDKVYMHKAGSINSLGIGKYAEDPNTVDIGSEISVRVRGKFTADGDGWHSLGLSDEVTDASSSYGRGASGSGCWYRVEQGHHVYVAFNCGFTFSGSVITVNSNVIPSEYCPARNVYAMCATGGCVIARVLVNKAGNVVLDWIQILSSAEQTTSSTVKWVDGYIDYWV